MKFNKWERWCLHQWFTNSCLLTVINKNKKISPSLAVRQSKSVNLYLVQWSIISPEKDTKVRLALMNLAEWILEQQSGLIWVGQFLKATYNNETVIKINANYTLLKRIMSWPCCAEDGCGKNLWQVVRPQRSRTLGCGRGTCIHNGTKGSLARKASPSFLKEQLQ